MADVKKDKELNTEVANTTSVPSTPEVVEKQPYVKKEERVLTELEKITGKYTVKKYRKTHLTEIDPNHDGALMFNKVHHLWTAPRKGQNTLTGLSKAQEKAFEEAMNLAPGTLSIYNNTFWGGKDGKGDNDRIKGLSFPIHRDGSELDCDNNIEHKLIYWIMKTESELDMSKFSMNLQAAALNPFCEYVVLSADTEAQTNSAKLQLKAKAMIKAQELSLNDRIDFLNVYEEGKYKVSLDSKPDFIDEKFLTVADTQPERFLETLADPLYKQFIFLGKAYKAGVIKKQGQKYFTTDGDLIGNSATEAAVNLNTPEYNSVKLSILTKLEAQK